MGTLEDNTGKRIPIATGALVLAILGAYGVSTGMVGEARIASEAQLTLAAEYLMDKPYLEVPPGLEAFVGAEEIDNRRSQFWIAHSRRGAPPIPSGLRKRRQQILDEKVDLSTEALVGLPDRVWGLRASEPSGLSFFTHAFVHSRFLHLATNVLIFSCLGVLLERAWGSATLLGFALCAAAVSGAAFVFRNPALDASLIGFSGVSAASLGAYAVNAGNSGRGAGYWFALGFSSLLLLVPSLLGQEWSLAPISTGAVFGPSQWSILGGVFFGLAAAPVVWLGRLNTASTGSRLSKRDVAARGLIRRARKSAEADCRDKSIGFLKQAIKQNPTDRGVALEVWLVACAVGLEKKASSPMLTAIRDELRSGEQDTAAQHWIELMAAVPDVRAEAGLMLRLTPHLQSMGRANEAVCTLERALEVADPASAPEVASNVALAARELDPGLARRAAERALDFEYLDPERRSSLELVMSQLPGGGAVKEAEPVREHVSELNFDDSEDLEIEDHDLEDEDQQKSETPVVAPQPDEMWELEELVEGGGDGTQEAHAADAGCSSQPSTHSPADDSVEGGFGLELPTDFEDLTNVLESDAWSATLSLAPADQATPAFAPPAAKPKVSSCELDVTEAVLRNITPHSLDVDVEGEGRRRIELQEVDALATALVGDLAPTPIVIIDLVFNWSAEDAAPLRVIRLRADHFDARQMMGASLSKDDAVRELLKHFLAICRPKELPNPMSVIGLPFSEFADMEEYERSVLTRQESDELELL